MTDRATRCARRARALTALVIMLAPCSLAAEPTGAVPAALRRPFVSLHPTALIRLGHTADWVAVTSDAVWVGSTGPNAVHRIDPGSNRRIATVRLPGEPCAGLAVGFGSLWVPLCAPVPVLARVDLATNRLAAVLKPGPAAAEGGIAASADSLWLVTDKQGTFARIDPASGRVRQTVRLPPGAFNPVYSEGVLWVSRVAGSELLAVDAATGALLASAPTGPAPRFLTAGGGAVWTLNQGDGSLSRIDRATHLATARTLLGTPGHGGDIAYDAGTVWTTFAGVPLTATDATTGTVRRQWYGPGGDSLGIGHGAIWLTDYHQGTIARIPLAAASAP